MLVILLQWQRKSTQRLQLGAGLAAPSPQPALTVPWHRIHSLHGLTESIASFAVTSQLPQDFSEPVKPLRIVRTTVHVLRQRDMRLCQVVELQHSHADLSPDFAR